MFNFINIFKRLCNYITKKDNNDVEIINNKETDIVVEEKKKEFNFDGLSVDINLINKIVQYDIIWVKMNEDTIRKGHIDYSHRRRPFLVMNFDYDNNCFIGYYLSSKTDSSFYSKNRNSGLRVILKKENYNLEKESIVRINKMEELPIQNVISYLDNLHDEDIVKLYKYIDLFNNSELNTIHTHVEVGDILNSNNELYIVYKMINDKEFQCYKMKYIMYDGTRKDDYNIVYYDNKMYEVDYEKDFIYNYDYFFEIDGRVNNDVINKIKNGNLINKNKYVVRNVKIGDIIIHSGKNYVIHQKDNSFFYGYAFSKTEDKIYNKSKDFHHIYINHQQFFVNYSDNKTFKIADNKEMPIVFSISEKDVDDIKKLKTGLKHNNKVEKKNKKKTKRKLS